MLFLTMAHPAMNLLIISDVCDVQASKICNTTLRGFSDTCRKVDERRVYLKPTAAPQTDGKVHLNPQLRGHNLCLQEEQCAH